MRPFICIILALYLITPSAALAADEPAKREIIYGWNLMTIQERSRFRRLYKRQQTEADKKAFLALHRLKMQARARRLGKPLPDMDK